MSDQENQEIIDRMESEISDLNRQLDDYREQVEYQAGKIKSLEAELNRALHAIKPDGSLDTTLEHEAKRIRALEAEVKKISGLVAFCLQQADRIEKIDRSNAELNKSVGSLQTDAYARTLRR